MPITWTLIAGKISDTPQRKSSLPSSLPHPITPSPTQLLCECCGYPIEGIAVEMPCPECGTPVRDSLPEHRPGSPWQRGPGAVSWLRTNLGSLARPATCWREVRIEPRRSLRLLMANLSAGAALGAAGLIPGPAWSPSISYIVAFFTVLFILLLALTSVEFTGIRLLGGRHGYRITPTVALTVCAHASAGWIIAGAGLGASAQILQYIAPLWTGRLGFAGGVNLGLMGAFLIMLLSFSIGMIIFSILCGVGYRALRFANAPRHTGD